MAMRGRIDLELRRGAIRFSLALLTGMIACGSALAQDNIRGGTEQIGRSIDPATLTYDILVDGNLERDDPANLKFKTLQAAYAAAGPGTESNGTVIGIKAHAY